MTDPLLGATVAGRYVVEASIGAGAMGAVYRAHQRGLDRPVALKVLRPGLRWGRDTIARFRREAKAMSALTHPNTVRVFDFGTTRDGGLFLAMELLKGKLCTDLIMESAVTAEQAVEYARQILWSIGEAHSKGIIHRDLKPDNVFIAQVDGHAEPIAKVLDFGIAKAIQGEQTLNQFETQDGTVFGTPRYMSPEQAQGKSLDHRSDLYAVGIILYELLAGAPPFCDDDAVVVMAQHIREAPKALSCPHEGWKFHPELVSIVTKALRKVPQERFQSAREFETALEHCARGGRLCVPDQHDGLGRARELAVARWHRARSLPGRVRWGALAVLGLMGGAIALALGTDVEHPKGQDVRQIATRNGMVQLSTEPRGVEVLRGGQRIGVTPLVVPMAPHLPSHVLLKKDGFVDLSVRLEPNDGERHLTMARQSSASISQPTRLSRTKRVRASKARKKTRKRRTKAARAQRTRDTPNESLGTSDSAPQPADSPSPYEKF
ncbi:MAG: serine/threonine-protein kinase [Myxococcales bacterium]|nr:serine/threonine-protein kinase [Myxococcales bacterium]MDD9964583.1 serine/threonine-protein kinase [Myxococcales bacterium]